MLLNLPSHSARYSSRATPPINYRFRSLLFALLISASAAALVPVAPAAHAQSTAVPRVALPAAYRISPGDTLDIVVFQKPELSRNIVVPPDGRISFPLIPQVIVGGRTITDVTEQIRRGLSKELRSPQVTVNVTRRTAGEVSVLGPVRSPGKRTLGDNWRVLQLIADSGGLSVKPEWATARLVRGSGAQVVKIDLQQLMAGDAEQNLLLQADDALLIEEVDASRVAIQVLGEVGKPGSVVVPKDGSLLSVITSVGGFSPRASLSRVSLMRAGKTYTLDMRDLLTSGKVVQAQAPVGISAATTATGGIPLPGTPNTGAPALETPNTGAPSGENAPANPGLIESPQTPQALQTLTPLPATLPAPEPELTEIKAEPGDTLLVPQNRLLFSVMGVVNRPGVSEFPENQPVTVLSAMMLAGGAGAGADLKGAAVVRPNVVTGKPDVQPINIEELIKQKNDKKPVVDVALQPGDILYIPPKDPGRRRLQFMDVLNAIPVLGWFMR